MEHLSAVGYNPHLHMILKNFQLAAMDSLRGPSRTNSRWIFDPSKMSQAEIQDYKKAAENYAASQRNDMKPLFMDTFLTTHYATPLPFLFPLDTSKSDKSETLLEGETIACFMVGGERRLCLPQILNTLLKPYTMEQVYESCSEMNIYFTRCNGEQLHVLKLCGILPDSAPSCGLITKTDASRLCHKLLYSCPEKDYYTPTPNSFYVYHGCFGKCKGLLTPELYIHPCAKCVKCCDCEGTFSLANFVCHSHKSLENRTCHWGFDSANWRSYLLLAKNQSHMLQLERSLEEIKSRFDPVNPYKRKESSEKGEGEKKAKYDSHGADSAILQQLSSTLAPAKYEKQLYEGELPAYLHRGPPVILNPERVVPFASSHKHKAEKLNDIAPNVSLAPVPQKSKDNDTDVSCDDVRKCVSPPPGEGAPAGRRPSTTAECDLNDSLEIDVSSTDDNETLSNNSDSGLSTPTDKHALKLDTSSSSGLSTSAQPLVSVERERKLSMLRRALDGDLTGKARDQLIDEFTKLCISDENQYRHLLAAKQAAEQELSLVKLSKKQLVKELKEANRRLKQDVECMRRKRDVIAQQLADERCRRGAEERLEKGEEQAKSGEAAEQLRSEVQQPRAMHAHMTSHLSSLHAGLGDQKPEVKYDIKTELETDTSSEPESVKIEPCKIENLKQECEEETDCVSESGVDSCSGLNGERTPTGDSSQCSDSDADRTLYGASPEAQPGDATSGSPSHIKHQPYCDVTT